MQGSEIEQTDRAEYRLYVVIGPELLLKLMKLGATGLKRRLAKRYCF